MRIRERIKRKIEKYRRIRHKGGHGIHSPFAFRLVIDVVEEQHSYYRLREFRKIIRQSKQSKLLKSQPIRSSRYYALIFRLINRFSVDQIIQVGTHFGLLQLLIRMLERPTPFYWIEQDQTKIKEANELLNEAITHLSISLSEVQPHQLNQLLDVDFTVKNLLFLHASAIDQFAEDQLTIALSNIHIESVWIVDAITFNPQMKQLWNKLKNHPKVVASFDIIELGVLVFNPKIHPQNYKLFF